MASSEEFAQYVSEQIEGAGIVRYLRMFGDYVVYCDERPVFLVCDDMAFAKKLPEVHELFRAHNKPPESGYPFKGAREHLIVDVEDAEFATELAALLARVLPVPKRRRRTKNKHKVE